MAVLVDRHQREVVPMAGGGQRSCRPDVLLHRWIAAAICASESPLAGSQCSTHLASVAVDGRVCRAHDVPLVWSVEERECTNDRTQSGLDEEPFRICVCWRG